MTLTRLARSPSITWWELNMAIKNLNQNIKIANTKSEDK
jgi:hypothetical protein